MLAFTSTLPAAAPDIGIIGKRDGALAGPRDGQAGDPQLRLGRTGLIDDDMPQLAIVPSEASVSPGAIYSVALCPRLGCLLHRFE